MYVTSGPNDPDRTWIVPVFSSNIQPAGLVTQSLFWLDQTKTGITLLNKNFAY